jgi:hypothetical protein
MGCSVTVMRHNSFYQLTSHAHKHYLSMQTYAICLGCVMFHFNKTSCAKYAILSINDIYKTATYAETKCMIQEY